MMFRCIETLCFAKLQAKLKDKEISIAHSTIAFWLLFAFKPKEKKMQIYTLVYVY